MEQSENGKLLAEIIVRHGLVIWNALEKCDGLVTRRRVIKNCVEESVIDFVIFSDGLDLRSEALVIFLQAREEWIHLVELGEAQLFSIIPLL